MKKNFQLNSVKERLTSETSASCKEELEEEEVEEVEEDEQGGQESSRKTSFSVTENSSSSSQQQASPSEVKTIFFIFSNKGFTLHTLSTSA